jgi:hypothetical protein
MMMLEAHTFYRRRLRFVDPKFSGGRLRRALAVELRHAGLGVEKEVPFELFHLIELIGRYRVIRDNTREYPIISG